MNRQGTWVEELRRTLPDDDPHPYRSGAWRPQSREWSVDDVEVVEGAVPEDLDGLYARNTENPLHESISGYHPFDGDGMVHAIRFRGGRASYRNRFVRTEGLLAEQEAGESLWAGLAESPKVATRTDGRTARGAMKDASSTDLVVHGGEVLTSFWQCGELYRLDADTLETNGPTRWDGWFPAEGVSAHTKVDEATGELFFFNYGTVAPYLHFGCVDRTGTLVHYAPVPLPGPRLPHDMAITEHFVVLNDLPMHWDEDLLSRGIHAVRMHDKPTRLAVVPRRGGAKDVQWFEADPTYVLHWTNAYEEGDDVVLEGFHQGTPSPRPNVDDALWMFRYLALDWMQTRLHRWRLNRRTGTCTEERMRDDFTEFGIINGRHIGRAHRYVWAATGKPGWFLFDGLVRHDTATGEDDHLRLPEGVFGSEVGVAPKAHGTAEDDAYVVTFTTDEANDRSECLVLDGRRISDGPIARLRLPERISSGTHAAWAPGSALRA
ncbi:MAG: Lignostilbene-alpha,beta-dioxygenase [Acidimicrobiales bacterium]|nr:Lignostilbene-alpha,beta-dioxygenase [Acidimicrobiales bacterium]